MLLSISKFLLLLFVIYLVRTVFRVLAPGSAAQRRPPGRGWRDAVRDQPGAPAQSPSWAMERQNIALDLVRCDRCGAYVPPKTACERTDCLNK